jgi:AcrR family transcriptional regulator
LRLPADQRRRQLLAVATEVFAARGFHATSMNEVAEAAGVTKPVLYQHFPSKRELYRELLDDVGSRLEDAIVKATTSASGPREQVEAGFSAYFRFVAEEQAAFALLFGGGTRQDPEFVETAHRVENTIAEAVAVLIDVEGLGATERRLFAHGVVGLAEGASRHWMARDLDVDPDPLARALADLAWRGLRGIRAH